MHIGLFDLYVWPGRGRYAKRILDGIEAVSAHNVKFITLPTNLDMDSEVFDRNEIDYLDIPESLTENNSQNDFRGSEDTVIKKFFSSQKIDEYDVIHFIYADDILGPLWRHCSSTTTPRLIIELNGDFFKRGTILRGRHIHSLFLSLLDSPVRCVFDYIVPKKPTHEALWRDLYLYRSLNSRFFNHMLVHTQEAKKYVSRLNTQRTNSIVNIPYPGPGTLGHEISKKEARDQLGLQQDDKILLYFGVLRGTKGIEKLLEALRIYEGPPFTMLIAGPLGTISEKDVRLTKQASSVNIITRLEYIETPEFFYRAADALIMPYSRTFGRECTSQTMFEACCALRPVIVPDFGAIGRFTKNWDLGFTYKHGSIEDIVKSMSLFARGELTFSKRKMRRFNHLHSQERVADSLLKYYRDVGKH